MLKCAAAALGLPVTHARARARRGLGAGLWLTDQAINFGSKIANFVDRPLIDEERRMALTGDRVGVGAWVPAQHRVKGVKGEKVGICAPYDEQGYAA